MRLCDGCMYLSPKEHEQKQGQDHTCFLYRVRIRHAGYHPFLPTPPFCRLNTGEYNEHANIILETKTNIKHQRCTS